MTLGTAVMLIAALVFGLWRYIRYSHWLENELIGQRRMMADVIAGKLKMHFHVMEHGEAPPDDCETCRLRIADEQDLRNAGRFKVLEDIPCRGCGRSVSILVPED